ncbi:DUF6285 domain-containing protein [Nocardioides campestrisoli]|uniref:DUF6285 domain-containing protein n=1 Tax=Nocardioides campestrisoli TaxID=2736757 RepID=UPI00163D709D|nr:DUF6285 domain-containing protein [Nocardioides campestrisoli]
MLHTFPDAREIVTAVCEFLRDEVMPSTEGALSFHARVAANLLDVLGRELEQSPEGEARLAEWLGRLDVADEHELALRVRSGELGPDDPDLVAALWTTTDDRLLVANPAYLDDDVADDPRAAVTR